MRQSDGHRKIEKRGVRPGRGPAVLMRGMRGAVALAVLAPASAAPAGAQHIVVGPDLGQWMPVIQPAGQTVAPVFEGWYPNDDGTYTLSFGYYSMNTAEVVHIPLGPDNFIDPPEFDGVQPTRFDPIPQNGARRHYGVFTIQVPADFGDRRVVWTLRSRGRTWEIPGHTGSTVYLLDRVEGVTSNGERVAAELSFGPEGPGVRGRVGPVLGPLQARAGVPLPLSVWVNPEPRPSTLVWWSQHQGPGEVVFDAPEAVVRGPGATEVATRATFSEPGEYVVRIQAVETVNSLEFNCCWTNAYVEVMVSP